MKKGAIVCNCRFQWGEDSVKTILLHSGAGSCEKQFLNSVMNRRHFTGWIDEDSPFARAAHRRRLPTALKRLRIVVPATVTKRCSRHADRTRRPDCAKSASLGSRRISVGSTFVGTTRVMNARITCRWMLTASVRQTAGLTLLPTRSSNEKGTKTTLQRIRKWFAIHSRINVFGRIAQKRKCVA